MKKILTVLSLAAVLLVPAPAGADPTECPDAATCPAPDPAAECGDLPARLQLVSWLHQTALADVEHLEQVVARKQARIERLKAKLREARQG